MAFYLWRLCAKVVKAARFFPVRALFERAKFKKSKKTSEGVELDTRREK